MRLGEQCGVRSRQSPSAQKRHYNANRSLYGMTERRLERFCKHRRQAQKREAYGATQNTESFDKHLA
jgi:hypothetical protein